MSRQVVIVGSGIIGLCSAHYAAQRGHRVVVLDHEAPGHQGCSYGNAGMIVPSHFIPLAAPGTFRLALKWMWNPESPLYVKPRLDPDLLSWAWRFWCASTRSRVERAAPLLRDLSLASRAGYEELAALTGNDFGLVPKGLMMLCKTQHALEKEARAAGQANRLGVPASVLTAADAARLDPGARLDIAGAVHYPKDCHLSPERFMDSIRKRLETAGVGFLWNTRATGFATADRRITAVQTPLGNVEGDEFVICGGSWSPELGRTLDVQIPMQAGKGYSVTLPPPRELPQICSILTEARVAVTPMNGALRVGGTMEIAGTNEDINPRRVQGILKALPRYYPAFSPSDFDGLKPWVGLRPVTPDGLPYLGRTQRWENLVVATGHAMMGLSLGPVSGWVVAQLLSDEKPSFDLTLLRPDRYN